RAAAPPLEITERVAADAATVVELSNGLTVIVRQKHTAPVVCVKAYVRAGGLYEREWLGAGVSHLLEHLVADDAAHHSQSGGVQKPRDETVNRVTEIGGQANAYTSLDHTCYYISAAAAKTDACIDLVADWLARAQFTRADFRREHGVVQRELEKGADEPTRQAWYAHMANAFAGHPAAVPVIGYAAPLAKLTWDDVRAYHGRMYVPQNTIFVVAGDVDTDRVITETRKAFAGWRRGRAVTHELPAVPPITAARRVTRRQADLTEAICRVSFRTVDLLHEDLYALDVLSYVLGHGRASRLRREVFRQRKLVTDISTSSWTPAWGRGVFTVDYRCRPDSADAAEQAVLDEIRRVVADGVTDEELARAKRQKIADHVHALQTAEALAGTLARDYMTTGDVGFSARYTDRIQAVTARQVRRAARTYLDTDAMAVTRLLPERREPHQPAASRPASTATDTGELITLPDGLRVVLRPADVGLVSMVYAVRGGVLAEDAEANGLGALMTALSTRGTKHYTAEEIDAFFDRAGGGIAGNCGNNTFYWRAECLADSFDEAIDIFAEVVTQPTFPPDELEILRPAAIARIRQSEQHWLTQLQKRFRQRFFAGSPYRLLPTGREEVVADADAERLAEHHRRWVASRPGEAVLAVYGEFDAARLKQRLGGLFEAAGDEPGKLEVPDAAPDAPGGTITIKTDKTQAGVIVAAPGMRTADLEDRIPMTVLDTIISGYRLPSGWLHEELRGKQLVYVVHAYNWTGLAPGALVVYAGCQPSQAPRVAAIIRRNLRRAASYTPTQAEIDRAVNVILTAEALGNQTMSDLAMGAALNELYGLGWDFHRRQAELYRAVTPADVRRVGRKYFSGEFTTVVTTPDPTAFDKTEQP
ncbi:MAG: M16 family metallopeptidase, partial [Planctomycetota bacterium]